MNKFKCQYHNCEKSYGRNQDRQFHEKKIHEFQLSEYRICADIKALLIQDLYPGFQPRIKQKKYDLNNSSCCYKAKTLQNLRIHMVEKHIEGEWICANCKTKLSSKARLSTHRVKCAKKSNYPMKCKGCSVNFGNRQDRYNHSRRKLCEKSSEGGVEAVAVRRLPRLSARHELPFGDSPTEEQEEKCVPVVRRLPPRSARPKLPFAGITDSETEEEQPAGAREGLGGSLSPQPELTGLKCPGCNLVWCCELFCFSVSIKFLV